MNYPANIPKFYKSRTLGKTLVNSDSFDKIFGILFCQHKPLRPDNQYSASYQKGRNVF
jgi:hypothetical protein